MTNLVKLSFKLIWNIVAEWVVWQKNVDLKAGETSARCYRGIIRGERRSVRPGYPSQGFGRRYGHC